jgi:hypothetical protein
LRYFHRLMPGKFYTYISRLGISFLILSIFAAGCQPPMKPPIPTPTTTAAPALLNTEGPRISSLLVGNNVWMYPDLRVWRVSEQAGLKIVRIGGLAYDSNMPSNEMLTGWVNNIKALGAEPMIQVSRFSGAESAAAVVKYFNSETGNKVKYWNIGNEPYCNKVTATTAADVAAYIKPIATAMKAVDATIKIFAPDECDFYDEYYGALFMGDNGPADISGKIPGQNYYFVDGISWHRYVGYPPGNIQVEGLTTSGANDYLERIQKTRALIDKANIAQDRSGDEALQWGIGEFNSSDGKRVCSFENGQMFAQVYGYIMKYGGTYGQTWSMFENGGNCAGTDFGYVNSKMEPRSHFYHMQFISEYMSGSYLDGTSSQDTIRAFGSIDLDLGRITVMLLNLDTTESQTCIVRLNSSPIETDECHVLIPVGLEADMEQTITKQTTMVLVLDLQGQLTKAIAYSIGDPAPRIESIR